jgi:coenzyme F420-reducing hydrogenase gamma subunit
MIHLAGFSDRHLNDFFGARRETDVTAAGALAPTDYKLDGCPYFGELNA